MSDVVLEGAVYVLANDLRPLLSKIGFTKHLGGAADRAASYCKQHGLAGWHVFAEIACFFPQTVEARVHQDLRRTSKHVRTATDARELFRVSPAEGKLLVERKIAEVHDCLPVDPSRVARLESELAVALKNAAIWKSAYEDWKQHGEKLEKQLKEKDAIYEADEDCFLRDLKELDAQLAAAKVELALREASIRILKQRIIALRPDIWPPLCLPEPPEVKEISASTDRVASPLNRKTTP